MRNLLQSTPPSQSWRQLSPQLAISSNLPVVIAAFVCGLISVVGLALVALCTWIQRRASEPPKPSMKGVERKVLDSFPKVLFKEGLTVGCRPMPPDCPICLAEFAKGDEIRILPSCGHAFHVGCVDQWLARRSSCPWCRSTLVDPAATETTPNDASSSESAVVVEVAKEAKGYGAGRRLP